MSPAPGQVGVRPLLVAGVAGGVGTSTWVRLVRLALRFPVEDLGLFRGGFVDVLVTSNTAAATARVGSALRVCQRPPVLVVMHTVPGVVAASRSQLRKAAPHVSARIDVAHQRGWLELVDAPGDRWSERKDVLEVLRRFPEALRAMYASPELRSRPRTGSAIQVPSSVPRQAR